MKTLMLIAGPILATLVGIGLVCFGQFSSDVAWTAGVTVLCAAWWISEPIPIPVTSLIPLAVLPTTGVLTPSQVGEAYGSPLILLMMGGFMLSTAMQRSGAHRRIALSMVNLMGGLSGRRLVFGFMAASALLSMWISNAATTLMLLPIAMAALEGINDKRLAISLLLGIAYAASIGGIGTPIGTPPNLVFMEFYTESTGIEPTFLQWMTWSLPISAIMLPLAGFWLTRKIDKGQSGIRLPAVGKWRTEETRTLLVFAITALLWVTRKQPFGGWSHLPVAFGWDPMTGANDASVALIAVVAMFLIPNGKGARLLDWQTASNIQWGILILFGGGITIARAFTSSGLSDILGSHLAEMTQLPTVVMIGLLCLAVTFLTEITSNTATATLLMPILAATAIAAGIDPKLIMVPTAISASFAFMLPVATPPNAIVFGSNQLTVRQMAREGLILNLLGVVVVTLVCWMLFG